MASKLDRLGARLKLKESNSLESMGIEFYSCDLGPDCTMNRLKVNEVYAPPGLIIVDGKCQHKRTFQGLREEPKEKRDITDG